LSDSPYRTAISGAVLRLQEEGKLSILKQNWWKRKDGEECEVSPTFSLNIQQNIVFSLGNQSELISLIESFLKRHDWEMFLFADPRGSDRYLCQ